MRAWSCVGSPCGARPQAVAVYQTYLSSSCSGPQFGAARQLSPISQPHNYTGISDEKDARPRSILPHLGTHSLGPTSRQVSTLSLRQAACRAAAELGWRLLYARLLASSRESAPRYNRAVVVQLSGRA